MPNDLQHELELISDFLQAQDTLRFGSCKATGTQGRGEEQHKHRCIKVPKLGQITVEDYNLPEMPSPTMTNVDAVRFDFKSSMRNSYLRSGMQYENSGLRSLCPNLFAKKFKKDPVPRQTSHIDFENKLPNILDPNYKENLIQRAQMRKTNARDLIFMSHMSQDRTVSGKFKTEVERKAHQLRYFRALTKRISVQVRALKESDPLNGQNAAI